MIKVIKLVAVSLTNSSLAHLRSHNNQKKIGNVMESQPLFVGSEMRSVIFGKAAYFHTCAFNAKGHQSLTYSENGLESSEQVRALVASTS